jgi:predicted O-methyltransferase YrrM
MSLINTRYTELLSKNFLTEEVSVFLYSMIRCCRPQNILEIGAGYSTLFLAKAIDDIKKEDYSKQPNEFFINNKDNAFMENRYTPKFTVVDTFNQDYAVDDVPEILKRENLNTLVDFVTDEGLEFLKTISTQHNKYDFIWLDFGSGAEYAYLFDCAYKQLPPGGIIIIHSTAGNVFGRLFLAEIKLKNKLSDEFEMITFVEPHKKIQNSFTVFKKNANYPIYEIYA